MLPLELGADLHEVNFAPGDHDPGHDFVLGRFALRRVKERKRKECEKERETAS